MGKVRLTIAANRERAAISGGAAHTLALTTKGTVVAQGWKYEGQLTVPGGRFRPAP